MEHKNEYTYRLMHNIRLELEKRLLVQKRIRSEADFLSTKLLLDYEAEILWYLDINERMKLNEIIDLIIQDWQSECKIMKPINK